MAPQPLDSNSCLREVRLGTTESLIPIISWADFKKLQPSSSPRKRALESLDSALKTHGFFVLENTGLEQDMHSARAAGDEFFNMPAEVKLPPESTARESPFKYNGFKAEASGAFITLPSDTNAPSASEREDPLSKDLKESFQTDTLTMPHMKQLDNPLCEADLAGTILEHPCAWPREKDAPGFRQALSKYYYSSNALAAEVGAALEEAVGTPVEDAGWLSDCLAGEGHATTLKLNRYTWESSGSTPVPANDRLGMAAHVDLTLATLIAQDETCDGLKGVKRLEVWDRPSHSWSPVPNVPGGIVFQLGGIGAMRSNGRWLPNWHKVAAAGNLESKGQRRSLVTFCMGKLTNTTEGPDCMIRGAKIADAAYCSRLEEFKGMTVGEFLRAPHVTDTLNSFMLVEGGNGQVAA
jgi:isopenicillin N synthase-like dioxygenase